MAYDQTQQIAPMLNPGDKLGYFEVGHPLAVGGMSLVWKGFDKLLNRHVAIKQIAAGAMADESMRERFRKEAELQKRVSAGHKNLLQIIDFIDEPRGLFIVMEYVDGSSLDTVLTKLEGPMDPKQALGIVHQIAVALVAVHHAGILHRDLKPSNILLPREGGVKICDFGLAAVQDEQEALTLGTARYMAPELFTGQPADARCDLYSLGMIAYEMLAGRPAFEETFKTVLRDQRNQALRWMKWHTNLRLAAPPLTSLNPHLPAELSELIARLMAKDPTQRVPTAAALIEIMRRLFTGHRPQPTATAIAGQEAAPQGVQQPSEPTAPLPKKSRLPLILGIVLGAQVVIFGGWFLYSSHQKSQLAATTHERGMEKFHEGQQLYKDEKFAEAEQVFQTLADQWPDDPQLGDPSASRALICRAQLLLAQGSARNQEFAFGEAAALFSQARDVLDKAENIGGVDPDIVKSLSEEAQNRESFSKPAQNVMDLTNQGQFNEARLKIRLLKETQTRRSDREDKLLSDLAARVEDQAGRAQIEDILKQADQLQADGHSDRALNVLTDAQAHFNSPDLSDRIRKLAATMDYDKTYAAAQAAETAGALAKAETLYDQANQLRPSKELGDKIKQIKSRLAFEEGRRLEAQGRLEDASASYATSDSLWPNDAAKRAMADLKGTVTRQQFIASADAAMTAGDYSTAINLYQRAMQLSPDSATQAKINAVTVRQKTSEARAALNRGDLSTADKLLADALRISPTDAQANTTRAELNVRTEYQRLLAVGDAARKRSLFGEASSAYRAARDKLKGTGISTDEITQRINDTEFDSWIAKARAAIEAKQWNEARAFLKSAQRMRDNDTVKKLMAEVDRNDPDNK